MTDIEHREFGSFRKEEPGKAVMSERERKRGEREAASKLTETDKQKRKRDTEAKEKESRGSKRPLESDREAVQEFAEVDEKEGGRENPITHALIPSSSCLLVCPTSHTCPSYFRIQTLSQSSITYSQGTCQIQPRLPPSPLLLLPVCAVLPSPPQPTRSPTHVPPPPIGPLCLFSQPLT